MIVCFCCSKSQLEKPWYNANDTDENNEAARRAYESVLTITLRKPDSPEYLNFSRQVKERARNKYGAHVDAYDEGVYVTKCLSIHYLLKILQYKNIAYKQQVPRIYRVAQLK